MKCPEEKIDVDVDKAAYSRAFDAFYLSQTGKSRVKYGTRITCGDKG